MVRVSLRSTLAHLAIALAALGATSHLGVGVGDEEQGPDTRYSCPGQVTDQYLGEEAC